MPNFPNIRLPRTDAHLHLTAHRAYDAKPEMTASNARDHAARLNLQAIGFVEHMTASQKHPAACLRNLIDDVKNLASNSAADAMDIRIGVELDIIDADGAVDQFDKTAGMELDYVIASVHSHITKTARTDTALEEFIRMETEWMAAAVMGPVKFAVLGHPWAISRRREGWRFAAVPDDCRKKILLALQSAGCAYNITHRELADANTPEFQSFVRDLWDAGIKIAVGSDAHALAAMAQSVEITLRLESMGMNPSQLWWPKRL